jgi:predicted acetyltransferase
MPGGGSAPCAGLTSVGVLPTRRRRGLLRALMRRQLDDAVARGEVVSALYASDARIYGRFGYGIAVPVVRHEVDVAHAALRQPAAERDAIELLDVDAALAALPPIYDAVLARTPGMVSRSADDWRIVVGFDPEADREGFTARRHAVLGDRGYASYRIKMDWADGAAGGRLEVLELLATDAGALAALAAHCLEQDLVAHVGLRRRPVDDPLVHLLADPGRVRTTAGDPVWLRLLSVPGAVRARGWSTAGTTVLEVADAVLPGNAGTWRLEVGPDGASCTPTTADADLALDVAELSGAFLGGVRLTALAAAGRVAERRAGAAADLDRLLASDLPWNPHDF